MISYWYYTRTILDEMLVLIATRYDDDYSNSSGSSSGTAVGGGSWGGGREGAWVKSHGKSGGVWRGGFGCVCDGELLQQSSTSIQTKVYY